MRGKQGYQRPQRAWSKRSRVWLWWVGLTLVLIVLAPLPRIVQDYPPYHRGNADLTAPSRVVAVVFGARAKDNQMSMVFRSRVDTAIDLYHQGWVGCVIFTGGFRDKDPTRERSEAELARDYALARGVAEQAILIETQSVDTWSNVGYALPLIRSFWAGLPKNQQGGFVSSAERVLLISDAPHLARAKRMFEDEWARTQTVPLPQVQLAPVHRSVFVSRGAKAKFMASEWLKTWAYWLGWYAQDHW